MAILILAFLGFKFLNNGSTIPNQTVNQLEKASLTIIIGKNTEVFDISNLVGKTALEATNANAKVVTSGTGANAFVTSINGQSASVAKREFWSLIINGKPAEVGAGSYLIKNNDNIKWQISTY